MANVLLQLLDAAAVVADEEAAETILPWMAPSAALALDYQTTLFTPGRILGAATALLGRYDEARAYYQQALAICEKVRFRPEIALIHFGLAELLIEHFPAEQAVAGEHLDFAIQEFEAMKMQPSLERALSLQASLAL